MDYAARKSLLRCSTGGKVPFECVFEEADIGAEEYRRRHQAGGEKAEAALIVHEAS